MEFSHDIDACLECLHSGGLILYPTDTVWGIGCDARNDEAVQSIIHVKNRPDSKSFVILVKDMESVAMHADVPSPAMIAFAQKNEKPVTFILNHAVNLSSSVIGPDGSVAIRIPQDDFCKSLLSTYGHPIVSTSANLSGQPTPAFFDEISSEIRHAVDYIVSFRQDDRSQRSGSTIIREGADGEIVVIRP
ncbi:MAG: threonylcarbamoyl-AMP synthase [Saprospiraceae bacterium]|nr:threonylcarbamoyl-AMP synthase [Saprospiraceae bacterium]